MRPVGTKLSVRATSSDFNAEWSKDDLLILRNLPVLILVSYTEQGIGYSIGNTFRGWRPNNVF